MWKLVENSNDVRPPDIDDSSSKDYVYVRKDFEQITTTDEDGSEHVRWQYMEANIPKEVFMIYESTMSNTSTIEDLEDVICELTAE